MDNNGCARRNRKRQSQQLVGRVQPCHLCHENVRVVYLIASDKYWVVDPVENNGPLSNHNCKALT